MNEIFKPSIESISTLSWIMFQDVNIDVNCYIHNKTVIG